MTNGLMRLLKEDEGQDLVEYVLLVVVVSLACVSGMSTLSTAIKTAFTSASTTLSAT